MIKRFLLLSIIGFTFKGVAFAVTAQSTITYSVSSIDSLAISGNPAAFNFNLATAGSQPLSISDSSTTLSLTTNSAAGRTLSCQLASSLPSHASLTVNVATGSSGGTSLGAIDVSDAASHNLVTGIKQAFANNMTVTYNFSVTVQTPITATTNDVLTFTLQ